MNNIIEFKDVIVKRGQKIVLNNINLSISKDEFVTIIGPNGAGKTTLVKCINGMQKISSGEIKVIFNNIIYNKFSKIRKKIGFVSQQFYFDSKFPISVYDVVSIGRFGIRGIMKNLTKDDEEIINMSLEKVGIIHLSKKPIGHISGGELQKVSIARVLVQEPEIIIFDEPTSNLDLRSQEEILRLIENIYLEKKSTIIFITHFLSHISTKSSKVVLIKNGEIVSCGNYDDVLNESILSKLYDSKVEVSELNGRKHFHISGTHLV
ncbi:MAG: ABC transporter ATP-binding protein [Endomicrobiia bacterium]